MGCWLNPWGACLAVGVLIVLWIACLALGGLAGPLDAVLPLECFRRPWGLHPQALQRTRQHPNGYTNSPKVRTTSQRLQGLKKLSAAKRRYAATAASVSAHRLPQAKGPHWAHKGSQALSNYEIVHSGSPLVARPRDFRGVHGPGDIMEGGGIYRDVRSVFSGVPHGGPNHGSAFLGIKGQIGHAREGKLFNYQVIILAN